MTTRLLRGGDGVVPEACVTVSVWPPIVSVPVRELPVVFGATVKSIDREPVPHVFSVIHPAVVVAVQLQFVPVVRLTLTVPPPGWTDRDVGLIVY